MRGLCRITALVACVVTLVIPVVAASAAPMTVERTEVRQVQSKRLAGPQKVLVGLPPGYVTAQDVSYPVVVVLGGEAAFLAAKVAAEAMVEPQGFRGAVLLGLGQELTPQSLNYEVVSAARETSAKNEAAKEEPTLPTDAAKMRGFLEQELLPWAAANYRLTSQKVLVGHSYEGLFAAHTLLTPPQIFDGYVISSAALWHDEGAIFDYEKAVARALRDVPARVFFAVGAREQRDPNLVGDVTQLVGKIRTRSYRNIETLLRIIDREGHQTAMLPAFSQGLQYVLGPKTE